MTESGGVESDSGNVVKRLPTEIGTFPRVDSGTSLRRLSGTHRITKSRKESGTTWSGGEEWCVG